MKMKDRLVQSRILSEELVLLCKSSVVIVGDVGLGVCGIIYMLNCIFTHIARIDQWPHHLCSPLATLYSHTDLQ